MLGIANRLVQVQQAVSPPSHKDDQRHIAGRQAEEKVVQLLIKSGNVSSADLFRALRVPDEFQTRRHEIDLVLLNGCGLYCLEVKNWGGKVTPCKDPLYWEQTKVTDSFFSKQKQFHNPVKETEKKANVLRNHLLRAGIGLSEKKVFTRVLLTNERCELHEDIAEDLRVITHDKLDEFASSFNRTLTEMVTDPFIPYFFRGQLSYSQMDQIRAALSHIGTWDIVNLYGGKQLFGDYKGCSELSFNRKDVEEMSFVHQRNPTVASMWAVFGYAPTTTVMLYKRGGNGWFNRETTAAITIPYNLDIAFRIAGESNDAKVPANDIINIILSN